MRLISWKLFVERRLLSVDRCLLTYNYDIIYH